MEPVISIGSTVPGMCQSQRRHSKNENQDSVAHRVQILIKAKIGVHTKIPSDINHRTV